MKMILEQDSGTGILPARTDSHGRDARATKGRGKKRAALFATKDFWRALTSASLPHAPTLRRLHD
jgi:hypothetical protein